MVTEPASSTLFKPINPSQALYEVGEYTYGQPCIHWWGEPARLKIGKFCSLAPGVQIFLGGEHRTDWVTTYPFTAIHSRAAHIPGHPRTKGDVVIGNDVWIGHEALILSGVTIGDGVVIGARAVVTKNVLPYAIVAGNPAELVRYRFSEIQRTALLRIAWWDWSFAQIREAWPLLLSKNIDAFIATYSIL